jgi:peptide-methionine (S)-S-oxide reductase
MHLRPAILATVLSITVLAAVLLTVHPDVRAAGTALPPPGPGLARATFAGGCFWCMEAPFERLKGVKEVISGYTGGDTVDPTYEEVSSGGTGHRESVQVIYDPEQVTYGQLLDVFWHNVDPTTPNRQFCDVGEQYASAIFVHDDEQKRLALASREQVERTKPFKSAVVTPVLDAGVFYKAEAYHQDYYKKNPVKYRFYRWNCGRDQRLKQLWGAAPAH